MKNQSVNPERGVALLFVLFALLLLTAIAATLMFRTDTETLINANYRASQVSYFASRAGLEEVRDRMRLTNPLANSLANVLPADLVAGVPALPAPAQVGDINGVVYIINQGNDPVNVTPWTLGTLYADRELCQSYPNKGGMLAQPTGQPCNTLPAVPGWYRNPAPLSTGPGNGTAAALPYKWVRITWKANQSAHGNYAVDGSAPGSLTATQPVCWDGARERVMPAGVTSCKGMTPSMVPVYLVTSLAITPTGSRRMTQMEVARSMFRIPSALTLDGDKAWTTFGTPTSNNYGVAGRDACNGGAVLPGIGVTSDADDAGVTADIFRPSLFTGETGAPSVVNLNADPSQGRLENLTTVNDLNKLVANITAGADQILKPPFAAKPAMGTVGNPDTAKITVIQGDYDGRNFPQGCDGTGILVVTGALNCGGSMKWDGLILVIGKGYFHTDGGGNGQINGALFIANLYDDTGKLLPGSSKPGIPTFDWQGGGSNFLQYNSCKIVESMNHAPYNVLSMREVIY
jgi:hypothetical protein